MRELVSSNRRLFGTDGVRGVANVEPMTPETVLRLGAALGVQCRRTVNRRVRVVIGRDTRRSGEMLGSALAAGLCSSGVDVLLAGVLPTPGVASLTRLLQAAAGAVVSASHNPFADNGVKIFSARGFKLDDELESEIERLVHESGTGSPRALGSEIGTVSLLDDADDRYRAALRATLPPDLSLRGMKIVIDCAHGAAYRVGPDLLRDLGTDVVALGVDPNGENINDAAGALHPEQLQRMVTAEGAQLGIALDGDADRVILVDELGDVVDGDEVLAVIGAAMLEAGTLRNGAVVATVMSNLGLEKCLRERGGRLVRTAVGDRHVADEMVRSGCNLGGEQSGHLLFTDYATTGDGLLAALQVMRLMRQRQQPLSRLKTVMVRLPQVLLNVRVQERRELDSMPALRRTMDRITAALGDRGRLLVRYSGTEPLLRIMVEGEALDRIQAYAQEIADAAQRGAGE